jgi:ATP-dependent DNA ligase I
VSGVLFEDVVRTSGAVAATRSRTAKRDALADLLRRLGPEEIEPAVGMLTGDLLQGRIGVGWATVSAVDEAPAPEPSLTVGDVDAAFTALAATSGPGSQQARAALLGDLFGRATDAGQELLRRLLVGELRQGALAGVMVDAIAAAGEVPGPLVRRAAMLSGDLRRTAAIALGPGEEGLRGVGLHVGRALQPMLASSAPDLAAAVEEMGLVSVEWKLDGVRVQVHRRGDEVRVFTRNLNDVTDRLPEVVGVARGLDADVVVLDGETLALRDGLRPERFQDTASRFGQEDGVAGATLTPFFFDILHLDGVDLIDWGLRERLAVLDELVGELRIPGVLTDDVEVAAGILDEALGRGHEGVMVKAAASLYEAGRRGKAWRKIKPVLTFDLVVLGAEWGHGRRQGWLSNLHLGARDPAGGFVMVGKTFKGLTDELLGWQTEALLEREVDRDGIVVHVRPELVVEIALDGVQASTRYPGGVALRFARVKGYRPDKDPSDADTIEALQALLG